MLETSAARGRGGGATKAHGGGSANGPYRTDMMLRGYITPRGQGLVCISMC